MTLQSLRCETLQTLSHKADKEIVLIFASQDTVLRTHYYYTSCRQGAKNDGEEA